MAKSITTGTMAQTTDAEFRAWVQEFHDLMVGPLGLVNTSDTGQLDIGTAVKPLANEMKGYRIYRTNDSLSPLYIKVEFGASSTATVPSLFITVATATNGSGTLTGVVSTRSPVSGSTPSAGALSRFANGKPGLWWVAFHRNPQSCCLGLMLSRTNDAAGFPTAEGFVLYTQNGSSFTANTVRITPTPQSWSTNSMFALIPYSGADGMAGDRPMVFGHQYSLPDVRTLPCALSYFNTTISEGVPFTVPILGTARTFMPLGLYTLVRGAGAGAGTNVVLALEW